MKPEQLNKIIRHKGRMQPWFMRNTNDLYENCVKSYYEKATSILPYKADQHLLKKRAENKAPVRALKALERERGTRQHQQQRTMSGFAALASASASAASQESDDLLNSVMAASRRRSLSVNSASNKAPGAYKIYGGRNMISSSSSSCTSVNQCADDALPIAGSTYPYRGYSSYSTRSLSVPAPRPTPSLHTLAAGKTMTSAALPPARTSTLTTTALMRKHQQQQMRPRMVRHDGVPGHVDNAIYTDPLMVVDDALKRRLSVKTSQADKSNGGLPFNAYQRPHYTGDLLALHDPKTHLRQEFNEQSRLRSLGDRIKQFECIQFADGPVTYQAFNRRAHYEARDTWRRNNHTTSATVAGGVKQSKRMRHTTATTSSAADGPSSWGGSSVWSNGGGDDSCSSTSTNDFFQLKRSALAQQRLAAMRRADEEANSNNAAHRAESFSSGSSDYETDNGCADMTAQREWVAMLPPLPQPPPPLPVATLPAASLPVAPLPAVPVVKNPADSRSSIALPERTSSTSTVRRTSNTATTAQRLPSAERRPAPVAMRLELPAAAIFPPTLSRSTTNAIAFGKDAKKPTSQQQKPQQPQTQPQQAAPTVRPQQKVESARWPRPSMPARCDNRPKVNRMQSDEEYLQRKFEERLRERAEKKERKALMLTELEERQTGGGSGSGSGSDSDGGCDGVSGGGGGGGGFGGTSIGKLAIWDTGSALRSVCSRVKPQVQPQLQLQRQRQTSTKARNNRAGNASVGKQRFVPGKSVALATKTSELNGCAARLMELKMQQLAKNHASRASHGVYCNYNSNNKNSSKSYNNNNNNKFQFGYDKNGKKVVNSGSASSKKQATTTASTPAPHRKAHNVSATTAKATTAKATTAKATTAKATTAAASGLKTFNATLTEQQPKQQQMPAVTSIKGTGTKATLQQQQQQQPLRFKQQKQLHNFPPTIPKVITAKRHAIAAATSTKQTNQQTPKQQPGMQQRQQKLQQQQQQQNLKRHQHF